MIAPTDSLAALEPGQRAAATRKPYPRKALGQTTLTLLVLLRIYVLIAVPIVVYAFVRALLTAP